MAISVTIPLAILVALPIVVPIAISFAIRTDVYVNPLVSSRHLKCNEANVLTVVFRDSGFAVCVGT